MRLQGVFILQPLLRDCALDVVVDLPGRENFCEEFKKKRALVGGVGSVRQQGKRADVDGLYALVEKTLPHALIVATAGDRRLTMQSSVYLTSGSRAVVRVNDFLVAELLLREPASGFDSDEPFRHLRRLAEDSLFIHIC